VSRRQIACLLAAAALAAPAVALADSPTDTTTEPVSTVTTLPSPSPPGVSTPAPDAVPARKAVHTRPKPVVHSAAVVSHAVTPPATQAPVHSVSTRPRTTPPPARPHRTTKKVVRHTHRATHRHATPAKHVRPVKATPKPVPAPAPAAHSSGSSWTGTAVIGGLVALLAAFGLVAGIRSMRRSGGPPSAVPLAKPAPVLRPALETAPTDPIAPDSAPIVAPPADDSCRIAWWRGYVRSGFYAYEGDGEQKLVAESPLFSWKSHDPPGQTAAALAAYERLVEKLERLGWEPDGNGETWFSGRFRRPVRQSSQVGV
jgi:hypothetical protein